MTNDPNDGPDPRELGGPVPKLLRFRYKNWKGQEYEYVIAPDRNPGTRLQYLSPGVPDRDYDALPTWHLSGSIVTRDGDPRVEMGPTRRRSFILTRMQNIEEVEDVPA